jgi:glycosyltransferase involved in cell wall biosynthesis
MSKYKVSVVMSVYNDTEYLQSSIQSILSQTFNDLEFIIVDDGSTDDTLAIVKRFNDPRIRLLEQSHKGLPAALNYGISKSSGELIIRMDADDISFPDRIENQVKFMDDNPNLSMIGGGAEIIDSNGKSIGIRNPVLGEENIIELSHYACPTIHPTLCFRRSVIEKIGRYRENFLYAQDYDLVLRMLDFKFRVENIPDILIKYRTNKKHSSVKLYKHLKFVRFAQKLHNQRIQSNNVDSYLTNSQFLDFNPNFIQRFIIKTYYKSSLVKSTNRLWVLVYYFISVFSIDLIIVTTNDYIYHHKLKKIIHH